MDSMLGYVEPPYKNIGLVPAKMDDAANFLPARLSALLMIAASFLLGLDAKNGWRIFRRDRFNHASPNSAQTESVCAGLLGVRLGYCLCADGQLLQKMSHTVQPWNVSTLAQAAGIAALQERAFLQKTRALIPTERQWLQSQLEALGFWVCPSNANYLLFHARENLHEGLREQRIAIRSCHNYHGFGMGWYRIAVRLHEENERLIQAIKEVCAWQRTL